MTEAPVSPDQQVFQNLKTELSQKLLADSQAIQFFGLSTDKVAVWIKDLLFDDSEIRVSPGFMSAGRGHNQSTQPVIAETDISQSVQNYLHESRHGMHNLVCETLFEGEDATKNLQLFEKNVLGDKPGGSPLQARMLKAAREISERNDATPGEIKNQSWMLGALTYQHAYYVDPGMCEAAASFHDAGVTLIVDNYNQWFAKLLLPGEQFFEGYANRAWQELFRRANPEHKALLVKKENYKRDNYFTA